jgi:hypothetical protein
LQEADTAQRKALGRVDLNAQFSKSGEPVGHQPFTARLINGRSRAVRDRYVESLFSCGNRCSEPCWAATDNEYIRAIHHA